VIYLAFHQVSSYRKMKVNGANRLVLQIKEEKADDWQGIYSSDRFAVLSTRRKPFCGQRCVK